MQVKGAVAFVLLCLKLVWTRCIVLLMGRFLFSACRQKFSVTDPVILLLIPYNGVRNL